MPTLSPAMDIQVSSNHERLLFELLGRDGAATAELMIRFRELGSVEAPRDPTFGAARLDDDETLQVIADVWQDGRLPDRPAHRGRHRRGPPPAPARGRHRRLPVDRPPGQVPRRGGEGDRRSGPSCPSAWPTCSTGPSTTTSSATTSAR